MISGRPPENKTNRAMKGTMKESKSHEELAPDHPEQAVTLAKVGVVTDKILSVNGASDLNRKVTDVQTFGNPNRWRLLCKASSQDQGWMKSTKVMEVPWGVVMQVTTQQRNPDGTCAIAEALVVVPNVKLSDASDGLELVPIHG